ncbi:MAG: hypothetical protein ACKVQW_16485 [Pyrinomonadaceae bacterium]
MRGIYRNLPGVAILMVAFAIGLGVVTAAGQESEKDKTKAKLKSMKERTFCGNNNWSHNGRESVSELREVTIPASGTIRVDGRQNGGISIKGDDRSDILVRSCVQAWSESVESAKSKLSDIKINTSGTIKAEGSDDNHWSVSFELIVPRSSNVNLTAKNGGISIYGIDGDAEFVTQNGGVFLSNVAGNFKGRTTNGGVYVKLSGSGWKGSGLDVTTTNGGVNIHLPENYAANIETATVNGGFSTDVPALKQLRDESDDKWGHRPVKINTSLNGGGASVRVVTTNGGVRISNAPGKE